MLSIPYIHQVMWVGINRVIVRLDNHPSELWFVEKLKRVGILAMEEEVGTFEYVIKKLS